MIIRNKKLRFISRNRFFFVPLTANLETIMKYSIFIAMAGLLLMAACGQSYEETKRQTRQQRLEAWKKDSAALKIAVMPTLDCLPIYVAEYYQLFDSLHGGVRLKYYMAQMDCDTALERGRVEGAISDLVRAKCMEKRGNKLRYVAATNAKWVLITNRNARIHQLKQLDDKMVSMTRFSATDLLTDRVIDSVKLDKDRVFKVQINDLSVRLQMLQNNEMDALWMPEPYATAARQMKHGVIYDSEKQDMQLGVMVFRDKEMQRKERSEQLKMFVKAYDQACDSINKYGVRRFRDVILTYSKMKRQVADSVPDDIKYVHAREPREKDMELVEKWLGKK